MESMITLYDANETEFTSLGIGVLTDAITCVVSEELNGAYELEMDYPISGTHYSDLEEGKIILAKPNDFQDKQPFRIYKITRPIDGEVTVYAEHISYDMSKVPVRKFSALNLTEIAYTDAQHQGKLKESQIIDSPFKFKIGSDKTEGLDITYQIKRPYNMRALIMGDDDSILKIYDGEFIFDKFDITLCNRRGVDRDFTIRYSKNMIDLEQETSSELMYTGICPYYSNTTTESKVGIGKKYKEIYISNEKVQPLIDSSDGKTIYPSTWLTYKSTGIEAITNILSLTVTNIIASEGEFQNHLVRATRAIPQGSTEQGSYFFDATYNMAYLNKNNVGGQDRYWLYKDIDLTECYEDPNLGNHVKHGDIFRIYTPGDNLYKVFVFDSSIGSDGEYRLITSDDNIEEYPPTIPSVDNTQEEKDNIITYEGDLIFIDEVRAIPKEGKTTTDADWLQKVEEQIQVINSDPRWKVPDEGGNIIQIQGVPSKTIYKVPTTEVATMAYPIEGKKEYERDWLTLTEGSTDPIPDEELIDGRPFDVPREDSTIYKCRWSTDDNKYNHRTDTRCTYTNYEWNGQQYVIHSTANDKILTLDLSDKFKETPKNNQKFQKDLYDETMTYIKDTKLGTLKKSIKVSFVKLSSSPEYSKWKQLETVALGDVVHVIYEDLGVNEKKKVIKTEYNVLTETYDSIEIGDKGTGFVDTAITKGDSVSALTNDRNFADISTVTKLVAERIEADYIHALTAEITEAQIQTLTTTELNATIITAEKFEIDKLVASLLVADDAAIRNTLVVGDNLIVNGEVNIKNGSISISGQQRIDDAILAYVNEAEGVVEYGTEWLLLHETDTEAQGIPVLGVIYKVEIDGIYKYYTWSLPESEQQDGHYEPVDLEEDVYFEVDESGNVTANSLEITGGSITIGDTFEVTNEGVLTAQAANIEGRIVADSGRIGDAYIVDGHLQVDNVDIKELSADRIKGGTLKSSEIRLDDAIEALSDEEVQQYSQNWLYQEVYNYEHAQYEKVTIIPEQNKYYYVDNTKYYIWNGTTYEESVTEPTYFEVDNKGNVTANSLEITGGKIIIAGDTSLFSVDQFGTLEANSVKLSGGEIENLNITGYLFFKSKEHITAYVMTSKGNTSYSDGYLTYTSDNSYMEYSGEYSYEDGVLTLTTNSQEAEYTRNYISYQGGSLDYSINYFGRLSEHNPTIDGKEGPALVPVIDKTYLIMDYRQGYEHTADLYGLYIWNGSNYVISQTGLYYISDDGLYLPGIKSTVTDGTTIAGFNINKNTIISSTSTTEVGICSDSSEDYAFWAGKANSLGEHPFSVTHEGYLNAKSGKIADLLITSNYLTSNSDKTSHSDVDEKGLFIDSNGITLSSTSQTESTFIRIGGEYGPITGIITPQLYVNFKNYAPNKEVIYKKRTGSGDVDFIESIGTTPFVHMDPVVNGYICPGFEKYSDPYPWGPSPDPDIYIETFSYRKAYTFMSFMKITDITGYIYMPKGYRAICVFYIENPKYWTLSVASDGSYIYYTGSAGGSYCLIGFIGVKDD